MPRVVAEEGGNNSRGDTASIFAAVVPLRTALAPAVGEEDEAWRNQEGAVEATVIESRTRSYQINLLEALSTLRALGVEQWRQCLDLS